MHNEITESLGIIGCGILGISLAVFFKMQDICDANDNLNLKQVAALFIKKCFPSYLASLTAVVLYAVTHESWIQIFTGQGEAASHPIVSKIIGMVMIMGAGVGFLTQYGVYRFALKRLDGILKAWGGQATDRTLNTEKKSETSGSKSDLSTMTTAAPGDEELKHK